MLEQLQKDVAGFQLRSIQAREAVNLAYTGGASRTVAAEYVSKLTKSKTHYLDSLKAANPLLWRIASLRITPDFKPDASGLAGEPEFIGKNFFSNANLTHKAYENLPDVFDAGAGYAKALLAAGAKEEQFKQIVEAQLTKLGLK